MQCSACQHENETEDLFCAQCGSALVARCEHCSAELKPDAKFCTKCGTTVVSTQQAAGTPAIATRAIVDHTPKHLADKILTSRSAMEGERKQVTVLFADVKGSMDLAGQLDPEAWHLVLDGFFSILTDAINRYEGTVNQYTGDGIMALFGAPVAHEDHAQRACYAALDAREQLIAYADKLRIERELNFGVRIGMNSGGVVVGKIGDDLRMDYTAQGHSVGLAQRIEQLAATDRIYLSEHTQRLADGYFEFRDLGASNLKGVAKPVGVFELERVGAARNRLDVSRSRGLTRFVGRNSEMDVLQTALVRAKNGHGQVVGVVGEPGLGKSRLCFEFVEQCRAAGMTIIEGHCPAHGKNIPYLPILELYRSYFGVTGQDSAVDARHKIAGALLLLDESLVDSLPVLFEFMGVEDPERPAPEVDADMRQRQLFELLHKAYRAQNDQGISTIAFIDDLHWIDPGSDAFVTQFVEATTASRNLLLVNFRPEYQADWTNKTNYQQLPLVPLAASDLRELVESLLGTHSSINELVDRIMEWTSGNPFFTEEVIQMLAETGHLEGTPENYRLVTPVGELQVPVNVRAVLAARIDRLPDTAKHVLQTASVIGKEFPEPLLGAIAEIDQSELASALDRLNDGDFVHVRALYPHAEYGFRHPLTQEVAYNGLLDSRRADIHAAVARAIEISEQASLDKQSSLLAYHWDATGNLPNALSWNQRAAVATEGHDAPASMRHWHRVREVSSALPPNREILSSGAVACSRILMMGWRLQSTDDESQQIFEDGKRMAEAAGNKALMARLYLGYGILRGVGLAYADDYLTYTAEAARLAEELNDIELQSGVASYLPWAHITNGDLGQARDVILAETNKLPDDPHFGASVSAIPARPLIFMANAVRLSLGGQLVQALEEYENARVHLEQSAFTDGIVYSDFWACLTAIYMGDIASARQRSQALFEIAESSPIGVIPVAADISGGLVALGDGNFTLAIELLQRARESSVDNRAYGLLRLPVDSFLVEALLNNGRPDEARRLGEELLATCRKHHFRMTLLPWISMARVHIQAGRQTEARSLIDEAGVILQETGARTFEPFLYECRAEFARAFACDWSSVDDLQKAHELFLEIGAPGNAQRIAQLS